jgi:hypothetical protein
VLIGTDRNYEFDWDLIYTIVVQFSHVGDPDMHIRHKLTYYYIRYSLYITKI